MLNNVVNTQVPVLFQKLTSYETEDTRFVKVKIWLMHLGQNFNGSYFEKSVVENAIPSLANTPILAYLEDNSTGEEDFSDHRMVLVKEDGKIKMKYIGQAIGLIPETNNAQFETRLCDDGIEREFLTVDGLIWTKWDDPIDIFNRDIIKSQSMELHSDYNGDFQDDNLFHFTDFKFFGACALGKEVLPAMINSTIETQFSLEDIHSEVQDKMEQFKLKFSLNEEKGGKTVDKKLELIAQYSLTEEQVKEKGIDLEEYSLEELEIKLKEFAEVETVIETEEVEQDEETQEEKTDFSLVASQLREEIRAELYSEYTEDEWGYKERKFWYVDHDDSMIIAEDTSDSYRLVGIPYSVSDDKVSVDFEAKKKVKISYQVIESDAAMEFSIASLDRTQYEVQVQEKKTEKEFSSKVEDVKSELENKTTEFNTLNEEVETLRNFKDAKVSEERTNSETELFGRFSSELTEEEINEVKAVASEFSLEELEEKLFTKVGKKKASFSKQPKKEKESIKIPLDFQDDEPKIVLYGDLFEKFGNK